MTKEVRSFISEIESMILYHLYQTLFVLRLLILMTQILLYRPIILFKLTLERS